MKNKKLTYMGIGLFLFLGIAWIVLEYLTTSMEKANIYSVSDIQYDDSTYRYVKAKCDSVFFEYNSENCINLRDAR